MFKMLWCIYDNSILDETHVLYNRVNNHIDQSLKNKILISKNKIKNIKREIIKL